MTEDFEATEDWITDHPWLSEDCEVDEEIRYSLDELRFA